MTDDDMGRLRRRYHRLVLECWYLRWRLRLAFVYFWLLLQALHATRGAMLSLMLFFRR